MRNTDHLTREQRRKLMFTISENAEKRIEKAREKRRAVLSDINPREMDREENEPDGDNSPTG